MKLAMKQGNKSAMDEVSVNENESPLTYVLTEQTNEKQKSK